MNDADFTCPTCGPYTPIVNRRHRCEDNPAVTAAAEAMHDAYEARAAEVGWETQARSRVAWADVPEANKQAMYAAVAAARPIIEAEVRERIAAEIEAERDSVAAETENDRAYDIGMTDAARIARGQT